MFVKMQMETWSTVKRRKLNSKANSSILMEAVDLLNGMIKGPSLSLILCSSHDQQVDISKSFFLELSCLLKRILETCMMSNFPGNLD